MEATRLSKESLVDLWNDLDSDDLEKMKFLLKDVAGSGKLKSASSALELSTIIENNKRLDILNGRFLGECFELMGRTDLVRKIGLDPTLVQNELGTTRYSVSPFRILLYHISEDLSTDEVRQLTFYAVRSCEITRKEEQNINTAFDLFVLLEKRGIIQPSDVGNLKEMVQSLENRGDLSDLVREYQGRTLGSNFSSANTMPLEPTENEQPRPRSAFNPALQPMPYYEMTANPRGLCVIINNKKFQRMKPREGTDEDRARLESTFRRLGFHVLVRSDLTSKDMAGLMKDIQIMDHSQHNALVVCILSHGGEQFVYRNDRRGDARRPRPQDVPVQGNFVFGTDDKPVPIRYLTMYFRASVCKTLADKPKLFFIQACQGEDMQTGVLLETDVDHDGPSIDDSLGSLEADINLVTNETPDTDSTPVGRSNDRKVIPDESDFLLGYATVFGYVSYRSRSQGSFYIKSLAENLNKFADTLDLQQIMTKVNHDVSEHNLGFDDSGGERKQVPMTQNQLRKLLYFSPDNLS